MLGTLGENSGFDLVFNRKDDVHSGMIRIPSGNNYNLQNLSQYIISRPGKLIVGMLRVYFIFTHKFLSKLRFRLRKYFSN